MQNQFVAFFKGNSSKKISVHKNIFDARRELFDFVKSPECKDISESEKEGIETFNDLTLLAYRSAVEGHWDAFVLPMKQIDMGRAA